MDSKTLARWMYDRALAEARGFGLKVDESQSTYDRPWGGYLRIHEESYAQFAAAYWQGVDIPSPSTGMKLAPKILLIAPKTRLSLQYHLRRSEHWRVLDGPVKVFTGTSNDDLLETPRHACDVVRIAISEWHRIVGTNNWARVAEIWQHAVATHPSDEEDIVRVQDDFGRR